MNILSDDDEMVEEPLEDEADEDLPADRSYDHQWVKRRVKGLYTNGWFIGEILYYNEGMKKFRVSFSDGSDDFITKSDIDNVDMFLLPALKKK